MLYFNEQIYSFESINYVLEEIENIFFKNRLFVVGGVVVVVCIFIMYMSEL